MKFIVLFLSLVTIFGESLCLVPPEAARPRSRRSAVDSDGTIEIEAMFQQLNEGLNHPTYSQLANRPGEPTRTHSCQSIREVPDELRSVDVMRPSGLSPFYAKYTEAYGIPVIGSSKVSDSALQRACYTLRFLLADNSKVRKAFYKLSGRVAIIGETENTNTIPEHSYLEDWWNKRARGLGATWSDPISTAGEENALCLPLGRDRYWNDDIVLHEYLHGLHNLGLNYAIPDFEEKMKHMYEEAKRKGMWNNTYSMSTDREYFAESGQSYLNSHTEVIGGDGIHNYVNTRSELKWFDTAIHQLFEHIFTCNNEYLPRCDQGKTRAEQREAEFNQVLKMDCEKNRPVDSTTPKSTTTETAHVDSETEVSLCLDLHEYCEYWKSVGECDRYAEYMSEYCPESCGLCV